MKIKNIIVIIVICLYIYTLAVEGSVYNTNSYIIVGEQAEIGDLIAALHLAEGLNIPLRNIRTDTDFIPTGKLYVIGGGSVNRISRELGYTSRKFIFRPVIVDITRYNDNEAVILAGYSASDTRSAVEIYIDSVKRK